MVRAVVGTMFLIGRHKMTLEEFEKVLNEGTRSDAGESMPGNALFLWDIIY
jgi:tRNA pseudouridine38-40 synthase